MSRRVAIVGIGLVTGLGSTREDTWSRMLARECAIRDVTLFDTEGYRSRLAAEVAMDEVDASLTAAERRRWSRGDQMGVHAAAAAIADGGWLHTGVDPARPAA